MKTIILGAGFFLLAGCSKSIDVEWSDIFDGNGNGDHVVTLKVLENKSNIPVVGATVIAEKCSYYDIEFGCTAYSTVATLVTDAQGSCTVTTKENIERVKASHTSYWPDWSSSTIVYLKPEAWARVRLRKANNYPANSQVNIGKFSTYLSGHYYSLGFNLPSDTVVMIRLYGEEQDQIWWNVKQGNTILGEGSVRPPIIPKWTTADVTIDF